MTERKLPIGIQSFEEIREEGYLYVDKTEYIWNLVNTGKTYFLSRPRRFGKSLLTSTIAAYFQGKKELFEGLAIERHENEKGKDAWQSYPVIYFSLFSGDYYSDKGIQDVYRFILKKNAERYGVSADMNEKALYLCFGNLIESLYRKTGKQVVVLVDDYDRPMLNVMKRDPEQAKRNKQFFISFFSVLKDEDAYVKFSFITGITDFHNDSVFSGLNMLTDISLTNRYGCICGITEKELTENFKPEIRNLAEANDQTEKECMNKLTEMYAGYHFSDKSEAVFNPFSPLKVFKKHEYTNYWCSPGVLSFMMHLLEDSDYTVEEMTDGIEATDSYMKDWQIDHLNPVALFYQFGYLTIRKYDREFQIYSLCFPNEEVRYVFLNSLIPSVLGNRDAEQVDVFRKLTLDIRNGDISSFLERLKALFAGIPYVEGNHSAFEREWRNEVYLIFALMGRYVKGEVHTARGRADCIAETKDYVYIFEFKLDQNVDDALKQIDEKGYAESYLMDQRKVCKVVISFSSGKRNIDQWKSTFLSNNS